MVGAFAGRFAVQESGNGWGSRCALIFVLGSLALCVKPAAVVAVQPETTITATCAALGAADEPDRIISTDDAVAADLERPDEIVSTDEAIGTNLQPYSVTERCASLGKLLVGALEDPIVDYGPIVDINVPCPTVEEAVSCADNLIAVTLQELHADLERLTQDMAPLGPPDPAVCVDDICKVSDLVDPAACQPGDVACLQSVGLYNRIMLILAGTGDDVPPPPDGSGSVELAKGTLDAVMDTYCNSSCTPDALRATAVDLYMAAVYISGNTVAYDESDLNVAIAPAVDPTGSLDEPSESNDPTASTGVQEAASLALPPEAELVGKQTQGYCYFKVDLDENMKMEVPTFSFSMKVTWMAWVEWAGHYGDYPTPRERELDGCKKKSVDGACNQYYYVAGYKDCPVLEIEVTLGNSSKWDAFPCCLTQDMFSAAPMTSVITLRESRFSRTREVMACYRDFHTLRVTAESPSRGVCGRNTVSKNKEMSKTTCCIGMQVGQHGIGFPAVRADGWYHNYPTGSFKALTPGWKPWFWEDGTTPPWDTGRHPNGNTYDAKCTYFFNAGHKQRSAVDWSGEPYEPCHGNAA